LLWNPLKNRSRRFLDRLFGLHGHKAKQESIYAAVVHRINAIALEFNSRKKINAITQVDQSDENTSAVKLWVAGHSLGGALATLFYSRLIRSESDIPGVKLAGAYTFGCPRTGDFDFLMDSITNERNILFKNRHSIWRVVNANDIVPRVPFGVGLCPDTLRQDFLTGLLNYFHFGHKIQLHYSQKPHLQGDNLCAQIGGLLHLLTDFLWYWSWPARLFAAVRGRKWPLALTLLLPWFGADHLHSAYYQNLGPDEES